MAESPHALPEEAYETLARAMHADYVRNQGERGATLSTNPSMVAWEELPEDLRESNRDQARHIGVKLAAVAYGIEPLTGAEGEPFSFPPEEIELLAEMEHERWQRQREAAGWTFGTEKDVEGKKSPDLVPWDRLPDEIREYDRDTVRGLPAFLAKAGFRIVRTEGGAHD